MEKRVIVFLIVSLAVIIGYDFLLKGMGLVPSPEPTAGDFHCRTVQFP